MKTKILRLVAIGMLIFISKAYAFYFSPPGNLMMEPPGPPGVLLPPSREPPDLYLPALVPKGCSEYNCMQDVPQGSLEGPYKDSVDEVNTLTTNPRVVNAQQGGGQIQELSNLNIDTTTAINYLEVLKPYLSPGLQKQVDELTKFLKDNPQVKVSLDLERKGDKVIGLNIRTEKEGEFFIFSAELNGDKATLDNVMEKWEEVKKNIDSNNGQLTPQGKELLNQLFTQIGNLLKEKKITLQNAVVKKTIIKKLDPTKDKATINKIVNDIVKHLKDNGLGLQAEAVRKEIEKALTANGVEVSSIEFYTNGRLIYLGLRIGDYLVEAEYNEKQEIISAKMGRNNQEDKQVYTLSVEKPVVPPGETKEKAAKEYFSNNFGITDPANHPQLKPVWTQIVNNWGNWTIASENTYNSTPEGIKGTVKMTLTYGGQKIQVSFDYTIIHKKP